jgi:hypothetical protein
LSVFKLVLSPATKGSENVCSNIALVFSRILVRTDVLLRARGFLEARKAVGTKQLLPMETGMK